jgi:hypothetical protein
VAGMVRAVACVANKVRANTHTHTRHIPSRLLLVAHRPVLSTLDYVGWRQCVLFCSHLPATQMHCMFAPSPLPQHGAEFDHTHFSLILKQRSVDFGLHTVEACDTWVVAFMCLLQAQRRV